MYVDTFSLQNWKVKIPTKLSYKFNLVLPFKKTWKIHYTKNTTLTVSINNTYKKKQKDSKENKEGK